MRCHPMGTFFSANCRGCYTKLRRIGRITVGGVGTLSALVVGSGVVGARARARVDRGPHRLLDRSRTGKTWATGVVELAIGAHPMVAAHSRVSAAVRERLDTHSTARGHRSDLLESSALAGHGGVCQVPCLCTTTFRLNENRETGNEQ